MGCCKTKHKKASFTKYSDSDKNNKIQHFETLGRIIDPSDNTKGNDMKAEK
jgi:hypothetical protein